MRRCDSYTRLTSNLARLGATQHFIESIGLPLEVKGIITSFKDSPYRFQPTWCATSDSPKIRFGSTRREVPKCSEKDSMFWNGAQAKHYHSYSALFPAYLSARRNRSPDLIHIPGSSGIAVALFCVRRTHFSHTIILSVMTSRASNSMSG